MCGVLIPNGVLFPLTMAVAMIVSKNNHVY